MFNFCVEYSSYNDIPILKAKMNYNGQRGSRITLYSNAVVLVRKKGYCSLRLWEKPNPWVWHFLINWKKFGSLRHFAGSSTIWSRRKVKRKRLPLQLVIISRILLTMTGINSINAWICFPLWQHFLRTIPPRIRTGNFYRFTLSFKQGLVCISILWDKCMAIHYSIKGTFQIYFTTDVRIVL